MDLQTSERHMMRAQPRTQHLDSLTKDNRNREDCIHFVNFLKTVLTERKKKKSFIHSYK